MGSRLLGRKLVQIRAFVLAMRQPLGHMDVHTAMLGLPIAERGFRDDVLAREIVRLCAGFVLLQHRNDLFFRNPCSLHQSVLIWAGL